ncbi:unnamed protein product [Coffea canephora]|uniref:DH200=94 genomic scaffold, scaffold_670 n=1 Tax=Coffea canephora TaxID=49390 RepID=A0A068VGQ9_COFCA|nr:unnamed protein product [Coffea canephora]
MNTAVLFIGPYNCSTVQPILTIERSALYLERAVGMYSALPYARAQRVIAEIPYVFAQTTYYAFIVYAMMSFQWTKARFFWFYFVTFFSFLEYTYFVMMISSISTKPTSGTNPGRSTLRAFQPIFWLLYPKICNFQVVDMVLLDLPISMDSLWTNCIPIW